MTKNCLPNNIFLSPCKSYNHLCNKLVVNVVHKAVIECQIWKSSTLCEAKPLGTILKGNVTVFYKFFKTLILRRNGKTGKQDSAIGKLVLASNLTNRMSLAGRMLVPVQKLHRSRSSAPSEKKKSM